MGNNVGWNPSKIAREWMNICQGFEGLNGLPFFAQTLWSVGPLPQIFTFGDSQYLFGNLNWGCTQDQFYYTGGGGGGSVKEPPKDEAELKLEKEKKEAEEAKRKKEKEDKEYAQEILNEKFDKLKPLLVSYKESLDKLYEAETDKTKKRELWDASRAIANCTSKATDANYEKMLEIYNANVNTIKDAKAKEITKGVTTDNNPAYNDLVTNLKDGIDKADETFGILKKSSSGAYKWGEISGDDEDQPIDIMELISAWNSTYVGEDNHAYLIKYIAEKRNDAVSANKAKYKTLSDNLHKQLLDTGTEINKKRLSAATKKALKDALDDFKKFDKMDKRFPEGETPVGQNYSNAFENLYIAIRLAEAEIADKDLEDAFNFLGDENPYKGKAATVETVEADLKSECRETKTVTEPVVSKVPSGATEIKIENTSYHIHIQDGATKYYTADGTEMTADQFKNTVGEVEIKENGTYSIKKGETITYYSAEHTEAPAAGSVKDAIGKEYALWNKLSFKNMTRSNLYNIIKNNNSNYKFNKDSVIGLIDKYKETRLDNCSQFGIIEYMVSFSFDKTNCNYIVKAVMRQALSIGLTAENCDEYKALATYFGAQGNPAYKEDGYTPDNDTRAGKDTFEFTKQCEAKEEFSVADAKEIDKLLEALVNKIKECNMAS